MKARNYKNIQYSEVRLSELGPEMRFDADFWEPTFLVNEEQLKSKKHDLIKHIAPNPQYGISISMNEEGEGYKILKMDNIMNVLAEDIDAKYANISFSTFQQFKLKKYDVLFNRVNSDDFVGRTGIYLLEGEHTFASYLVRLDSGQAATNCYIAAFLNSKHGKKSLQRVKRRSVNQANINAKELGNLVIPKSLVGLDMEILKLITESQKLKTEAEKFYSEAEDLFLDSLGMKGWKPRNVEFKISGVPLQVEDAVNGEVWSSDVFQSNRLDAEFWQPKYLAAETALMNNGNFKKLSQVANIKKGIQARSLGNLSSGIKYASIKDCDNLEIVTSEFTNAKNAVTIAPKELVFAITGATIGKTAINNTDDKIAISGDLAGIYNIELPSYYLLIALSSFLILELAKRYTTGATNGHLSITDLMDFAIPLVDEGVILAIEAKMISSFLNRTKANELLTIAKESVDISIESSEIDGVKFAAIGYERVSNLT